MEKTYLQDVSVLYVEDSKFMREVLAKRLVRKVKELIVSEDGNDALEKYKLHNPDIVLTDIEMPGLNGCELALKIKEINEHAVIIVLSAHSSSTVLLEALESGVSGYLLKPVDKEKLHFQLELYAKMICLDRINKLQEKKIKEQEDIILTLQRQF